MVKAQQQWVAVWTRPRHEKRVNERLVSKGVETFLPLVTVPSSRKDRRAFIDQCVFPSYLFAHVDEHDAYSVCHTRGVMRILGPGPWEYTTIPDEQVEAVRTVLVSRLRADPFPELKAGTRVRVVRGPLKGLEGCLVERRRQLRLVVAIDLMRQGISAEVSADQVEPI